MLSVVVVVVGDGGGGGGVLSDIPADNCCSENPSESQLLSPLPLPPPVTFHPSTSGKSRLTY